MEKKNTVEVIEIRFAVGSETSTHKVLVRDSGRSVRNVVEPICVSKAISVDKVGVYLDSDRSRVIPLDYDIYALAGHNVHIVDYKAPVQTSDELDGRLSGIRGLSSLTSLAQLQKKKPGSELRVASPSVGRRGPKVQIPGLPPSSHTEMFTQQRSSSSSGSSLTRATSGASALSQARRSRPTDAPTQQISNKLLGLSEERGHHRDQSVDENNADAEKHKKSISMGSGEDGDISPGGTLHKNRGSTAKLSIFSVQPQNSKDREKMEKLAELLDLWGKHGLPKAPDLAEMPVYDPRLLELEEHWTVFIDKTGLTQKQKDQQEAIWELLYTEVYYIRALHVIHDLFISCLLNIQNETVLNEIDIDSMFANITELANINYEFWSTQLIKVLEYSRQHRCLFNPSLLKPAFSDFGDRFRPYIKYCIEQKQCSNYVKANKTSNPLFSAFVAWAEAQKQCKRLELHDLLVKPMQRLTKYRLLLEVIAKKTEEENVKQDLREMIDNVKQFVSAVDLTLTKTDEKEKLHRLSARIESYEVIDAPLVDSECSKILNKDYMNLDLMSPMPGCGSQLRYVMMEGPLRLRDMNTKSDVHCILFTDMLLFTKVSKRDSTKLKIFKPPIRIDSLSIHEMKESTYVLLVHLTDFGVAQAAYTLHGENISRWVRNFKKAQSLYMKCKEQARKESATADVSITDFELDDIGFSGPLDRKPSDAVFNIDNGSGYNTPKMERTSSYSSLNEGDDPDPGEPADTSSSVSKSISSPEIGRKHNTLPPNYKHPPQIKVHRKSSSSSGSGEKRRNHSSERCYNYDGVTTGSKSAASSVCGDTSEVSSSDCGRVSWELGDYQVDNNNSSQEADVRSVDNTNCDMSTPTNLDNNDGTSSHLYANTASSNSLNIPNTSSTGRTLSLSRSEGFHSAGDMKSRKLSNIEILRMRQNHLQEILADSSQGVEI